MNQVLQGTWIFPPNGLMIRGCFVFMMIPGYFCKTADKAALKYNILIWESREKSDDNFHSLLGDSQYVEPTIAYEA